MTKNKPIIVYGIDVSECLLFDKRKGICFKNKKSCSAICSYATYKLREQLYYKTQECEQKDKDIKYLIKCLDNSFKTQQDSELYWEREKKKLKTANKQAEQKLERIRELLTNITEAGLCEAKECGCDDNKECLECTLNEIKDVLQIIDEVQNDN